MSRKAARQRVNKSMERFMRDPQAAQREINVFLRAAMDRAYETSEARRKRAEADAQHFAGIDIVGVWKDEAPVLSETQLAKMLAGAPAIISFAAGRARADVIPLKDYLLDVR